MEPSRRGRARGRAEDALVAAAEAVRDSVAAVVVERFTRPKYHDAVDVALDVIDTRIGAIKAKPKPTQRDSQSLELMREIKSDMQSAFRQRWDDREGHEPDWHPKLGG